MADSAVPSPDAGRSHDVPGPPARRAALEGALALAPEDPDILTSKALVLLANSQPERAVRILEPVVSQFPDVPHYSAPLAVAYFDDTLTKLTRHADGRYFCTEEHHPGVLVAGARRIERLRVRDDPEVKDLARQLRDLADGANEVRWDLNAPAGYLWLGGLFFVLVCGLCGSATQSIGAGLIFGLLLGGGAER